MFLQLKIDSAKSVGETLQDVMSLEYVWETGKRNELFHTLVTRITKLCWPCHG
jgi:hypothetical protein